MFWFQDHDYAMAWVFVIGYSVLFVILASAPVVVCDDEYYHSIA